MLHTSVRRAMQRALEVRSGQTVRRADELLRDVTGGVVVVRGRVMKRHHPLCKRASNNNYVLRFRLIVIFFIVLRLTL